MKPFIFGLFLGISSLACSDMTSRPETADKWKPILLQVNEPASAEGVYTSPLFGTTVTLDFYVIAPEGEKNIEAEAITPDTAPLTIPLSGLQVGTPVVTSYPGLELIRIPATASLPSLASLSALFPALGEADLVRFRYGLKLSAAGRSLPIYGDFPVYRSLDVEQASWSLRSSRLIGPEDGAQVGTTVPLLAEVVNPQDEPIKVGWYVSAGEVKNRRSISTEWELPGAGTYTVIMTIRGKQSRSSKLLLRQVTVP